MLGEWLQGRVACRVLRPDASVPYDRETSRILDEAVLRTSESDVQAQARLNAWRFRLDRRSAEDRPSDAAAARRLAKRHYEREKAAGGPGLPAAARTWARRCLADGEFGQAAAAASDAVDAMADTARRQAYFHDKRNSLAGLTTAAWLAARAYCEDGRPGPAAAVLERAQLLVLEDMYLRPRAIEAAVRRSGDTALAERYDAVDRVLLVPTGVTAALPLQAGFAGTGIRVTSLPATSLARPAVPPLGPDTSAVAVAVPRRPDAGSIPGTVAEVAAVRRAFPGARPLVDRDATLRAVTAGIPAELLHFGCHGVASTDVLAGALLLADGDLTVGDILDSPAQVRGTRLAVLSACRSAVADRARPGEAVNLSTAVLVAGADAVIGSLWPVSDAATTHLMSAFYAALADGADPARALRTAQRTVGADPRWRRPYYWAGFAYWGL
ncbi:CHAT domain-containing protein [Kitasatospora sp. NPDC127067]|uniref:CHAT domain-containing protein n=1 Tax=Kitasatospora sp. NPDC127067 TaxID=3347126 RepID=UPI003649FDA6